MAETTSIEWTDATFNPWIGCTRVSPACDHCYAARQDAHRKWTPEGWGGPRRRTSEANWAAPLRWNKAAAKAGTRPRVFCASLADWLDNEVPIGWLVDLLDLIRRTPELDWLLLSKRIGNWRKRLEQARDALLQRDGEFGGLAAWIDDWLNDRPPANVWLGATVIDQAEADRDIPKLLALPAPVRFLSIEPMLGPITLPSRALGWKCCVSGDHVLGPMACGDCDPCVGAVGVPMLRWVIGGFESGPHARPGNPMWARSLRDQCAAAGTAFLWKQNGEWALWEHHPRSAAASHKFDALTMVVRVGKDRAGRLLDGVEHNGFPA